MLARTEEGVPPVMHPSLKIPLKLIVLAGIGLAYWGLAAAYPVAMNGPEMRLYALCVIIFLTAALFSISGPPQKAPPIKELAVNLLAWAAIVGGMSAAYDNRVELQQFALRTLSFLQPGRPIAVADGAAILSRGISGHFTARATINGKSVDMLVDTGSTDVALPYAEARRLGIDVENLTFDRPVMTANGRAMVAAVRLEKVAVGNVVVEGVRASVAEEGRLGGALLGMSYLSRLSEFSFQGDKLVLRK